MLAPSLTAHAILRLLLSNLRPNEGIGKACSQSDAFLVETAKSLALSLSEVAEARSKSNFLLHKGRSHSFWLEELIGS
jgi:hypothetical protein